MKGLLVVALLSAVAVNWKRLVLEGIANHEGQKLLGKLVGAVVVGRASNERREAVRPNKGPNQ